MGEEILGIHQQPPLPQQQSRRGGSLPIDYRHSPEPHGGASAWKGPWPSAQWPIRPRSTVGKSSGAPAFIHTGPVCRWSGGYDPGQNRIRCESPRERQCGPTDGSVDDVIRFPFFWLTPETEPLGFLRGWSDDEDVPPFVPPVILQAEHRRIARRPVSGACCTSLPSACPARQCAGGLTLLLAG
jgi:hypothetical protein